MFRKIEKTAKDGLIMSDLIMDAFAGFPWYENLSEIECIFKVCADFRRNEFTGFLLYVDDIPVAANWIDKLSITELRIERGNQLAKFVETLDVSHVWWGRDLVVHPDYQMKGYGTQIRDHLLQNLKLTNSGEYIFTRMRQDNFGSLKICEKLGYAKTEILVPSSQVTGLFHEYYYLKL